MDPDKNVTIQMPSPLAKIDTSAVHLYARHDSVWYKSPFVFRPKAGIPRTYEILGEWRPGTEYSLEIDSAAFTDIYGLVSKAYKQGLKVKESDAYSSLFINMSGMNDTTVVAQLLDASGKAVKEVSTKNGTAEFYYVKPGTYYLCAFIDSNKNGRWDTGDYAADRQPETTYYYPEKIECKAKWDMTQSWDPASRELYRQKPYEIVKQKPEKEKTIKRQNLSRAQKMGIKYIPQ
jgi:hypothetical protein